MHIHYITLYAVIFTILFPLAQHGLKFSSSYFSGLGLVLHQDFDEWVVVRKV